jgi:hypothetical protein
MVICVSFFVFIFTIYIIICMSKSWGTPTWYFFHSLAEQVKEEEFINIKEELFNIFKSICSCLPCNECTQHANDYIKRIRFNNIKNKEDFKNVLFMFHNEVNMRKGKPVFTNYDMYKGSKLQNVYNNFKTAYTHNYNLNRGFMDTMYRKNTINTIESFFKNKKDCFIWI